MSRGKIANFKQILYSPYEIGLGVTKRKPLEIYGVGNKVRY